MQITEILLGPKNYFIITETSLYRGSTIGGIGDFKGAFDWPNSVYSGIRIKFQKSLWTDSQNNQTSS